ncbi:hypothetical protein M0R45_006763 [Rubus argutus]|uniref:Uncharacterized protein n=1 Tax=Rubus argutus TaxID=59490 RepID=A0AAW1YRP5_RUBAR
MQISQETRVSAHHNEHSSATITDRSRLHNLTEPLLYQPSSSPRPSSVPSIMVAAPPLEIHIRPVPQSSSQKSLHLTWFNSRIELNLHITNHTQSTQLLSRSIKHHGLTNSDHPWLHQRSTLSATPVILDSNPIAQSPGSCLCCPVPSLCSIRYPSHSPRAPPSTPSIFTPSQLSLSLAEQKREEDD